MSTENIKEQDRQIYEFLLSPYRLRKYIQETKDLIEKLELFEQYLYGQNGMDNKEFEKAVYELYAEQEDRRNWKLEN